MSRCLSRLAAALAVLTFLGVAQAQPAPQQTGIEPPRAELVTEVAYPEGGEGDTKVILLLVISKDGTVESAAVAQGDEPFASAAREAATGWTFVPATRNGEPVAVKIRFEVVFEEKRPATGDDPEPESKKAQPDEPTKAEPQAPAVIDVVVEGVKHPPSVTSLRRAEVRQLPGAFGDPFRAIEIMPGVTPIVSGLPFFYVRGAPPGNIGYFLDGVRVPYLFHAAAGPSVVHPGIVERVDLYSGGYPARHGRYAGAVVSAEATEPNPEWHGEGVLRLVDVGGLVEGGFHEGRGTALLAGRYSYTAGVFSLISPEITLDYRDFQSRVTYDITDHDRVSLFSFGAYDFLSSTKNDIETVLFGTEFYRVDARYDARLPGGGNIRTAVTWGFDRTQVADGRNTQDMLYGTRVELSRPLDDNVTLRAGLNLQHDDYSADDPQYVDPDDPGTQAFKDLFPPRHDAAAGGWFDLKLRLGALEAIPGVRLDTFYSNGATAVSADPRFATIVHLTDDVRVLHALGLAHQPPSFIVPIPGLEVANLSGGLQRSLQTSAGLEIDLPWETTASVTAFDVLFMNMTDSIGVGQNDNADSLIPRSEGSAKGVEVYLRRSLSKRIGGFISYTFSRSTRTVGDIKFPAAFDRTHVLHSAVGFDLSRGWRTGTRFSIYSGAPLRSTPEGGEPIDVSDPPRDPVFYRLDFRIEKKWQLMGSVWLSVVLEMVNATLNTETIDGNEVGPITLPSIGLEGGF
jgi:TonB family protein